MLDRDSSRRLGRFTLGRHLGSGGMGVVYEAVDERTGARVALKTLHDPSSSLLFELKREFRAVHGLRHPNLVELGELYQDGHDWFFTMELVEGRSYLTWLCDRAGACSPPSTSDGDAATGATHGPITVGSDANQLSCEISRLRDTLPQLASALAALHAAGLVHGDVKPSNIVVTDEGRLVLLDFGLVRSSLFDEHISGEVVGTLAYMAPEQTVGAATTPPSDCYAMGVILYQALTGRAPFVGEPAHVLFQKRQSTPVPPQLIAQRAPDDLDQLCLALLQRNPASRPTARQVVERLAAIDEGAAALPVQVSRFVGRQEELARIRAVYDDLAEAGPSVIVLHGESGIGKTTLVLEALRHLSCGASNTMFLRGSCFERETVAYAGVDMVVDALATSLKRIGRDLISSIVPANSELLSQLFPVLQGVAGFAITSDKAVYRPSREARARARGAFSELFARLGRTHRLVVFIDDAQWVTHESRLLLESLLSPDDSIPLLLLLAYRAPASELETWIERLPCRLEDLSVGPLPTKDSIALLREYSTQVAADTIEAMAHDSGGHPLFLHELGRASVSGNPGISGLEQCFDDRAAHLTHRQMLVLRLVCSAARPMKTSVVGAAAATAPGELEAILRELKAQRLLVTEGSGNETRLRPMHDRVRQAVLGRLNAEDRPELRRRIALAMERESPNDVEALAMQWNDIGERQRAARFACKAAEKAAAMLAFERAIHFCDIALADSTMQGSERAALFIAKGEAYANLGRGSESSVAYLAATQHCTAAEVDGLVLRGADQLIRAGRINEGKRLIDRILDRLDLKLAKSHLGAMAALLSGRLALALRGTKPRRFSEPERARAVRRIDACWSVGDLLGLVDPVRSLDLHTRGLRIAIDVGEPERLARAMASDAWFISTAGVASKRKAISQLDRAELLLCGTDAPQIVAWTTMCRGVVNLQIGNFEAAQREFDAAELTFESRCRGTFFEAANAREFALWTLSYRGQLESLLERLPRAVDAMTMTDNRIGLLRLRCGPSHVALLARDQPQQLLATCEALVSGLSRDTHAFPYLCTLFARTHAFIYLGRARDALDVIERELAELRRAHLLRSQFFRVDFLALHARAALAAISERGAGTTARFTRIAEKRAWQLRREGVPWAAAFATAIEASLRALERGAFHARAELAAAARELDESGLGLYADALSFQILNHSGHSSSIADRISRWQSEQVVLCPARLAHAYAPVPVA